MCVAFMNERLASLSYIEQEIKHLKQYNNEIHQITGQKVRKKTVKEVQLI